MLIDLFVHFTIIRNQWHDIVVIVHGGVLATRCLDIDIRNSNLSNTNLR